MKAVLIDDVENSRIALRTDINDYCPEIEIIGEASGVVEGVKLIRTAKPDLVFLDIEMADGNGFDLLEMFDSISFQVIFITGMDAYAIKAFKYSAIDYLLKPVDPIDLTHAVERAVALRPLHHREKQIEVLLAHVQKQQNHSGKLALASRDKVQIVNISDIIRCESDDNYTRFFIEKQQPVLISKTLKEYEPILNEHGFLRVHQSHMINPEYITEYVKTDGGHLLMTDKKEVPVAHRRRDVIQNFLNGLGS